MSRLGQRVVLKLLPTLKRVGKVIDGMKGTSRRVFCMSASHATNKIRT